MKNELYDNLLEEVSGGAAPELPAMNLGEGNYSSPTIDDSRWKFDIQEPTEPGMYKIQSDIDLDGGYVKPTGGEPIIHT